MWACGLGDNWAAEEHRRKEVSRETCYRVMGGELPLGVGPSGAMSIPLGSEKILFVTPEE